MKLFKYYYVTWRRRDNFSDWISSDNSRKQRHKYQLCQGKNKQDEKNCKWRLCGERDEMINPIISKYSKLAQREYKTRHNRLGKEIHWKLCKKFRFDFTNKWCIHNPEFITGNKTHKILWYFNIQTDHLMLIRWPDVVIDNNKKRSSWIADFDDPTDHSNTERILKQWWVPSPC